MSGSDRPSVLVAAIGNPDRGDDAVGPAVASRLRDSLPARVRILDRGGDVLALIEAWDGFSDVFVVDAAAPIGRPGRIHRLDLAGPAVLDGFARNSTHAFGVGEAVELARSLNRLPRHIVAYLVEGEQFDLGAPLSPAVAAAVEIVVRRIRRELALLSSQRRKEGGAEHA
jgi:hydrogenase maturation protease